MSFIKGDLERLYMNGVDDEYFKSSKHQSMLLNILFVWVTRHRKTGYRQGMHEIVAPVLLVLQEEREAWTHFLSNSENSTFHRASELKAFARCLSEEYLEASVYWIFERIMKELEPLYSPVTSPDEQPLVVHYCTKIQGIFIAKLLTSLYMLFICSSRTHAARLRPGAVRTSRR